jgi:hypothetical protein
VPFISKPYNARQIAQKLPRESRAS